MQTTKIITSMMRVCLAIWMTELVSRSAAKFRYLFVGIYIQENLYSASSLLCVPLVQAVEASPSFLVAASSSSDRYLSNASFLSGNGRGPSSRIMS